MQPLTRQDQSLLSLFTEIIEEFDNKEFSNCCGAKIEDDETSVNFQKCTSCND